MGHGNFDPVEAKDLKFVTRSERRISQFHFSLKLLSWSLRDKVCSTPEGHEIDCIHILGSSLIFNSKVTSTESGIYRETALPNALVEVWCAI